MSIIDKSIFVGDIFIPNAINTPDIHGGTQPTNVDKLTIAIDKYEKLLLINAIGVVQYNALIAGQTETSGKWYDLINGKEYGDKSFPGIKQIIAYYVFVNFLKEESVQFNTTGLERSNAANSTSVDPRSQLVTKWNQFVNMYQGGRECCCFFFWDFGYNTGSYVTLQQYLRDFPEDYNSSFFQFYAIQNFLGI